MAGSAVTDGQHVALREFIERILAEESKRRDDLRAEDRRALDIQAREYERRLDALNHEHARLDKAQLAYVPRETYEHFMEETREWRGRVETFMSEQAGARKGIDRTAQIALGVIALMASIASIVGIVNALK